MKFHQTLRARLLGVGIASSALFSSAAARSEVPLNDPEKANGWAFSTSGQLNAYLIGIAGETVNRSSLGNPVPEDPATFYRLVGPQVNIQGNPTPTGALSNPVTDTDLNTIRIRGGFASTILNFMLRKQVLPDLKMLVRLGFWAGIDNPQVGGVRGKNDLAAVDWREQYIDLSGSWGTFWGGRKLSLFSLGALKLNWNLMHQHGVGHPCTVDGSGIATCGHVGLGTMFPNRNAQIGYSTPEVAGLQLAVAVFDPSMINDQWNRVPLPRVEGELTFRKEMGGPVDYRNEVNVFASGLTQTIARTQEVAPQPAIGHPGVPADAERNVWGAAGGAWGRFSGFGIGASGWYGQGLGTATAFGNTAVDDTGVLRKHFGYLGIVNFRYESFEIAASYGTSNVEETDWDKSITNPDKISVIKQVRGIGAKVAYHLGPLVFSIDGMNVDHTWWRGEKQNVNIISGGLLAKW